jgi:D-arginine utilization repressor
MWRITGEIMQNNEFTILWKQYEPLLQALVELFHPFAEAAVHDLEKGIVVAIYHNLSQRKVGGPSPLKELKVDVQDFPDYFAPYNKENWDGRPLKCTSITLRNKKGKAVGLICINVDTSFMQDAHRLLEVFLKTKNEAKNPIEIFGAQCEDQAAAFIQNYLDEQNLSLKFLTREQKKEVVQQLFRKGIFNYKSAAPFIARKLNISRASVYNYIK